MSYCIACGEEVELVKVVGGRGWRCDGCDREIYIRILNEVELMNK